MYGKKKLLGLGVVVLVLMSVTALGQSQARTLEPQEVPTVTVTSRAPVPSPNPSVSIHGERTESPAGGGMAWIISYQGVLTDENGRPINGYVDMTFRLYNTPTGGTPLWVEEHTGSNAVPVEDGLFYVYLGSLTLIDPDVWASGTLYLGVQVADDSEMSPREVVGVVPGSLSLEGKSASQFVQMAYGESNALFFGMYCEKLSDNTAYCNPSAHAFQGVLGFDVSAAYESGQEWFIPYDASMSLSREPWCVVSSEWLEADGIHVMPTIDSRSTGVSLRFYRLSDGATVSPSSVTGWYEVICLAEW